MPERLKPSHLRGYRDYVETGVAATRLESTSHFPRRLRAGLTSSRRRAANVPVICSTGD